MFPTEAEGMDQRCDRRSRKQLEMMHERRTDLEHKKSQCENESQRWHNGSRRHVHITTSMELCSRKMIRKGD